MNRTLIFLFAVTCPLLALVYLIATLDAPSEVHTAIGLVVGFALGSFGMRA